MLGRLKDIVFVLISLIGGYAFLLIVSLAATTLFGYLLIQFILLTINDPSPVTLLADAVIIAAVIFGCTRKRFRDGLVEIWNQVRKNM